MLMTRSRVGAAVLAACAGAILACGNKQDPRRTASADSVARAEQAAHALIGPAAKAALDSGNALFRKRDYAGALAQYRAASALAPQHAAPLFGIYMVARATNDSAMADSALAGIRLRSGPLPSAPHSLSDSALRRLHDSLRRSARPVA